MEKQLTVFAQRLVFHRKRRGLSQGKLANAAGVPVGTIYHLEQGVNLDPKLSTVTALAAALHITLDELAGYRVPGGGDQ